jgi:hypothetical protein
LKLKEAVEKICGCPYFLKCERQFRLLQGEQEDTTGQRRKAAIVVALAALGLLIAGAAIWWKPIVIKYHKHRIDALLNEEPESGEFSGYSYYGEDWINALEGHRDSLVELGYLVRKEFPLDSIKQPSLRFRRLWEELGARFPDYPHVAGLGYDSNYPATILVWDEPERLPEWERIIKAHDSPPTNEVKISEEGDPNDILPFIGRWANEDGDVCYVITRDAVGTVRMEEPPNEVWRPVFRNIRLQEQKILFDQFMHSDPNDDFKSMMDKSGHHPFSGVRCETIFEINPLDPNELFARMSALSKYGAFMDLNDPNVSVFRRLESSGLSQSCLGGDR